MGVGQPILGELLEMKNLRGPRGRGLERWQVPCCAAEPGDSAGDKLERRRAGEEWV